MKSKKSLLLIIFIVIDILAVLFILYKLEILQIPRRVEVVRYIVQENDTLLGIAQEYNVSVRELAEFNKLKEDIQVGQVIKISPQTMTHGTYILVWEGDTIQKIAYDHGCSVEKLMELNDLSSQELVPLTKIFVPIMNFILGTES